MITDSESAYVLEHAYVPEHVPDYVSAISGCEPHLVGDFLVFAGSGRLIFVGYPLEGEFHAKACDKAFSKAVKRFRPARISITAPRLPTGIGQASAVVSDHYYRLELAGLAAPQKVRNMLSRASHELAVLKGRHVGEAHAGLIEEFLVSHEISDASQSILRRIPGYLNASETAVVFEARNREGNLVAFDVAEYAARDYVFYLFNFSSDRKYVPGASDLLLHEMIGEAVARGKRYVNMGLGIDPGIVFFKTKWGARLFLPQISYEYAVDRTDAMHDLLNKL